MSVEFSDIATTQHCLSVWFVGVASPPVQCSNTGLKNEKQEVQGCCNVRKFYLHALERGYLVQRFRKRDGGEILGRGNGIIDFYGGGGRKALLSRPSRLRAAASLHCLRSHPSQTMRPFSHPNCFFPASYGPSNCATIFLSVRLCEYHAGGIR